LSESSLSINYGDLMAEVGRFLGYPATLTDSQSAEVDSYVQSGVRQFYYPPVVEGVEPGYAWSFLAPTDSLTTTKDQPEQDLPDDLGRILGNIYFDPSVHRQPAMMVSQGRILQLQQQGQIPGVPKCFAVRHKASDGEDGQRLEIVWWPTPSDVFDVKYRYEAYTGKLSEAKPYPLGGMRNAELIIESCLAVAEQRANDESGVHWGRFAALLAAGIAQDRRMSAGHYGQMGEQGGANESRPRRDLGVFYPITYKGETW